MSSTCDACDGAGTTVPRGGECSNCGGAGKVRVKQEVAVEIPVGMWVQKITNDVGSPII